MEIKKIKTADELTKLAESGKLHGLYDVPEELYHAGPGISQTMLGWVNRCPAYAQYRKGIPLNTVALRIGSSFDCMVFTPNDWNNIYRIGPEKARNTVIWKDFAKENTEHTLFKPTEVAEQQAMKTTLMDHDIAGKLIKAAIPQICGYVTDDDGTIRRCRADALIKGDNYVYTIGDLKTTKDARPHKFVRSVMDYRYHCQNWWYVDIFKNFIDIDDFLFICIEKEPPYLISINKLTEKGIELGGKIINNDLVTYKDMQKYTDIAKLGYDPDIQTMELPKYAYGMAPEEMF